MSGPLSRKFELALYQFQVVNCVRVGNRKRPSQSVFPTTSMRLRSRVPTPRCSASRNVLSQVSKGGATAICHRVESHDRGRYGIR